MKSCHFCYLAYRKKLVGGDWNHGILNGFSIFFGSGRIIPTDELIFFRGVETTNQIAKVMNQDKSPLT